MTVACFLKAITCFHFGRVRSLFICDDQRNPTNFSLAKLTNMKVQ